MTSSIEEREARFALREAGARAAARSHGDDVRAAAGLVVTATKQVMGVVADMQRAFSPPLIGEIAALAHAAVAGTTGLVGAGVDVALAALAPFLGASAPGPEREALLAALNGVVGDRLAEAKSPLAIEMTLRPPLDERREGALLLFLHGSSLNDLQWRMTRSPGVFHDHGRSLMRDLERDVTLAYAHYNSGRHVKHNGDDLALLIEREAAGFDEIILVGHSMGGLVARSAMCAAEREGHAWRKRVSTLVTLGTPHHGAPLERLGHLLETVLGVTPWTAPLATLGTVRSAGVTDLRHGNVIDVDADRFAPAAAVDTRPPAPLPAGVRCYAVAATRTVAIDASPPPSSSSPSSSSSSEPGAEASLAGDDLVPVASALGMHEDPARALAFAERKIVYGTNHLGLLASEEVYASLLRWCAER